MKSKEMTFAIGLVLVMAIITASNNFVFALQSNHTTILITNNSAFTSVSGVTSGSGTALNPYIIENLSIDASGANGIQIQNTTVYFIIRNCLVENEGTNFYGIYLDNTTNGEIMNNVCNNNHIGIILSNSSYENLTNNVCKNNYLGIYLESSSYNNLSSDICVSNSYGISLEDNVSNNNIIYHNTCLNNDVDGIFLNSPSYNNLINNTCKYNKNGIYLLSSLHNNMTANICSYNYLYGIKLDNSSYNTLFKNTCNNNLYENNIQLDQFSIDNVLSNNNTTMPQTIVSTPTPIAFNLIFTSLVFLPSLVLIVLVSNKLSKRNKKENQ
ncbi:MAG: NosD domain-containing protein [Nitrososphaeria archaeon]|jgi:parallel beta-helix repeat protein